MEQKRKRSKFDMAPLIDVVFLLLIFFMLTFAVQGEGMDISLPEGQTAEEENQNSLTVKIEKGNTLKVNNKLVSLGMLQKTLEQHLDERNDKSIVVEVHKMARYELFSRVLDISQLAGAEGFSIIK